MLPAAVTGGQKVILTDLNQVRGALNSSSTQGAPYTAFKDLSGDGSVILTDFNQTRSRLNSALPAGEPVANVFASGSSVIVESVDGTNGVGSVSEMVWAAIGSDSTSSSTGTKKRTV